MMAQLVAGQVQVTHVDQVHVAWHQISYLHFFNWLQILRTLDGSIIGQAGTCHRDQPTNQARYMQVVWHIAGFSLDSLYHMKEELVHSNITWLVNYRPARSGANQVEMVDIS